MKRRTFIQAASLLPFIPGISAGQQGASHPMQASNHYENATADFFYRPGNAWAADFIPFYADNKFQLFFLLDWRDTKKHGEGTPWYRVSITDFVTYKEHGEMLPRGTKEEQDLYVFTGSVLYANNQYHIFYTGHNPYYIEKGKPQEAVMHAVSNDLDNWRKIKEDSFFALSDDYEMNDWRDPFVFWNEETKEFNMLTAARYKKGIPRRRGLTALSSSRDLKNWAIQAPLYAPGLFFTHECPDLFKMGDWWYFVFSEFSDRVRTRYRMSRKINGPWITPQRDDFDGHAYYAAKTASDGKKRFLFGWNPTKTNERDNGNWEWGGNLVVHELVQLSNGELGVRLPDTVRQAFKKQLPLNFSAIAGNARQVGNSIQVEADESFGALMMSEMPPVCKIETSLRFSKKTGSYGIIFRCDPELNNTYCIRIEPAKGRLVFDMYPRKQPEAFEMVECSREVNLQPGTFYKIELIMDGNKGVVYVNETVAMNFRAYDITTGGWGFFAENGAVTCDNLSISVI